MLNPAIEMQLSEISRFFKEITAWEIRVFDTDNAMFQIHSLAKPLSYTMLFNP